MSLKSIQEKLNKKFEKIAKRPKFSIVLSKNLSEEEKSVYGYYHERMTNIYKARAKGIVTRRKFPGKDSF